MSSEGIRELEEDLKALDESIEHWVRMRDGTHRDGELPSGMACACCQLCMQRQDNDDYPEEEYCEYCPIYDVTGEEVCLGTPYKDAYDIRVLNLSFSATPQSYYWEDPLNQATPPP